MSVSFGLLLFAFVCTKLRNHPNNSTKAVSKFENAVDEDGIRFAKLHNHSGHHGNFEEVRLLRELLDAPATAEASASNQPTTSERTEGPKATRDPPRKESIKSMAQGKTVS